MVRMVEKTYTRRMDQDQYQIMSINMSAVKLHKNVILNLGKM